MAKIALFVPRQDMLHYAHNLLQDMDIEIDMMKMIKTDDTVLEARRAAAEGVNLIIARGLQASLIKTYTQIPVVEIMVTAQEMAILVKRAKEILHKTRPVIGVVGSENMFCDMSYFNELYDIDLRLYFGKDVAGFETMARMAVADRVDLIIGGEKAVGVAEESNIPSLFVTTTQDSMKQAFYMARNIAMAMAEGKKTSAQMDTLLDHTYNGVLRIDGKGMVTMANGMIEDLLKLKAEEMIGKPLIAIIPQLDDETLQYVLEKGQEYPFVFKYHNMSIYAVLIPVTYNGKVDSAILTCNSVKHGTVKKEDQNRLRGGERSGAVPMMRFEKILQNSQNMKDCIHIARLYSMSEQPVVLTGESGTEKRNLAESIHNNSSREQGPFLDVPCKGLTEDEQRDSIFGDKGAVAQSEGGTLLIRDVEHLTAANQYRLYQLIRFHVYHGKSTASLRRANVRVMVTIDVPLHVLMEEKKILEDLYYLLSGLQIAIPPLRDRKEDLKQKIEDTISECCSRYSRYHVLTKGAMEEMLSYPWQGNLFQIESFCERLILTAQKRTIDEIQIRQLMNLIYPAVGGTGSDPERGKDRGQDSGQNGEYNMAYGSSKEPDEAVKIRSALEACGGSREKTAEMLGISKATLWRRMKKYKIETK